MVTSVTFLLSILWTVLARRRKRSALTILLSGTNRHAALNANQIQLESYFIRAVIKLVFYDGSETLCMQFECLSAYRAWFSF